MGTLVGKEVGGRGVEGSRPSWQNGSQKLVHKRHCVEPRPKPKKAHPPGVEQMRAQVVTVSPGQGYFGHGFVPHGY